MARDASTYRAARRNKRFGRLPTGNTPPFVRRLIYGGMSAAEAIRARDLYLAQQKREG